MSDYTVSLGAVARTLNYEDACGIVLFTFDLDSVASKKRIILEPPSRVLIDAEQLRLDIALERAKQYLISLGYEVEVFGR